MTTNAPSLNAEQVREAYKLSQLERRRQANQRIQQNQLAPIVLIDTLPNGEGLEENLIPIEKLADDLKAQIPTAWSAPRRSILYVYLNDQDSSPIFEEEYATPPAFPLEISIPSRHFQSPGVHRVRYVVAANAATERSDYTRFTVDTTDPNRNVIPAPLALGTDQVTPEYLDVNDGLPFTIAPFTYPRAGDRAEIYMTPPGGVTAELVGEVPPQPVGFDPLLPMTGIIAKDKFVNANDEPLFIDGTLSFYYLAYSRAGNQTRKPDETRISMAFLPQPDDLQNAVIPLATEAAPLIDRADAYEGVIVEIPEFTNYQPNDQVVVSWGEQSLSPFLIGSSPTFPLQSSFIPFATLLNEGSEVGEGPKDVTATYRIERGLLRFNPPAAVSTGVDLRSPGPVNPGPDPENPLLGIVTVLGGGSDPEANKIRLEDVGHPVSVTLPIYNPAVPGEVLQVFWNKKEVPGAAYTVVGGESEFSITVPFDFVAQEGDGPTIPVYIKLTSPTLPEGNAQLTVPTNVEVNTFEFDQLTPPSFPDINRFQGLGCCERIWEGAKLRVAGDTRNFAAGDKVTVHWQGRDYDTGAEIPDTTGSQDYPLSAEEASNGFDHTIDFDTVVMPVADVDGKVHAWYEITKAGGAHATTTEVDVEVAIRMPGGCRCIADGACDTGACSAKNTKTAR